MHESRGRYYRNRERGVQRGEALLVCPSCDPTGECPINWHWRPYGANCAVCDLDYDLIGKTEDFEQDAEYAIRCVTNIYTIQ